KTIFGKLIFSYEKENNTIKDTLLEAIKEGVNLEGANLYGANLRRADLEGVNLYGADLRRVNLRRVNLRRVNLEGANLYGADLEGANLEGVNLEGADLRGANLEGANLYRAENTNKSHLPMYCKWNVSFFENKIKIGCKTKTIKEWDDFFKSDRIYDTQRNTEDFKRIEAVYLAHKTYYEFLNK